MLEVRSNKVEEINSAALSIQIRNSIIQTPTGQLEELAANSVGAGGPVYERR